MSIKKIDESLSNQIKIIDEKLATFLVATDCAPVEKTSHLILLQSSQRTSCTTGMVVFGKYQKVSCFPVIAEENVRGNYG